MEFNTLPEYIRERWEASPSLPDGRRTITTLVPVGRGGKSCETLTLEEFTAAATVRAERNEAGFFLAHEVAKIVARNNGWGVDDELDFLLNIAEAAKGKRISVLRNGRISRGILKEWERYQSLSDEFAPSDVNAWLESTGATYRMPVEAAPPVVAPAPGQPIPMSRAGMVNAHKWQWSAIEADMNESARNGLAVAKAGARGWIEPRALDWARAKGKLRGQTSAEPADPMAAHYGQQLSKLPNRTHKG